MSDVLSIARGDIVFSKPIGHGGYSTVYKGVWNSIHVAAKRLNRVDKNELEILSKLKHPNIVELIGVIDQRPDFFLVLELCGGGSLRQYLDSKNNIPVHELLCYSWGEQSARAIHYLQENHVIHRDVKSSNLLITDFDTKNLKLCDFGISKTSALTVTTQIKGTWGWTAPEAFIEEHISPLSDIYSYATVLWEIITGRIPFHGCEYQNVMYRVCEKKERPEIPADCPEEIAQLLQQCWEEDRNKRPSIGEVVKVLAKYRARVQEKYMRKGVDIQKILPFTRIIVEFDGTKRALNIFHGATIDNIKVLIQEAGGVPPQQQKLFHNKQELIDTLTLSDYGIHDGSTVVMRQFIRLCIRKQSGKSSRIETSIDETIEKVKSIILDNDAQPEPLRLVHNGILLSEKMTLRDYQVHNEAVIFLENPSQVSVQTTKGTFIQIQVFSNQTVAEIKEIIQQTSGIPCDKQHLICRQTLRNIVKTFTKARFSLEELDKDKLLQELYRKQFEDHQTLSTYNVKESDILCLMDLHSAFEIHEIQGWYPKRTFLVLPSLTINDIKDILGLDGYELPLSFKGKSLEDDKTLFHYGISDGSTITYRYWLVKQRAIRRDQAT